MPGQMYGRRQDLDGEEAMLAANHSDPSAAKEVTTLLGYLSKLEDAQPPPGLVHQTLDRVEQARGTKPALPI